MTDTVIYDKKQIRETSSVIRIVEKHQFNHESAVFTLFDAVLSFDSSHTSAAIKLRSDSERDSSDSLCYIGYFSLMNLQLIRVIDNEFMFSGVLTESQYTETGEAEADESGDRLYLPSNRVKKLRLVEVTIFPEAYGEITAILDNILSE